MTRVVFMGTPESAVPTLHELAARFDVALVITQPDRPRGRSGKPLPPPVKTAAAAQGIEVSQPESRAGIQEALAARGRFDVGVVTAYGRILRSEVLAAPAHGLLNLHFSLLPRWRGASPVRRALLAGDTMTGVTIIRLDEGLDTGPVVTAQAVDIRPGENAGDLESRLGVIGGRLLASSIEPYLRGELNPVPQSEEGATYASKIGSEERVGERASDAAAFVNLVRALAPSPAATLDLDGVTHKILDVSPSDVPVDRGEWRYVDGTLVASAWDRPVRVNLLQPPGRKVQKGADWARGRHKTSGTVGPS